MKDLGTVRLESERLVLRKFRRRDYTQMFNNWASDPRVTKYLSWTPHHDRYATLSYLSALVKRYKKPFNYDWAIELKSTGKLIGSIGAVKRDSEWVFEDSKGIKFEIGYCLGYDHWGKGYATEAMTMVRDYLFYECGVERIVACHHIDNPSSGNVMRKIGMQHMGDRQTEKFGECQDMLTVAVYALENIRYDKK